MTHARPASTLVNRPVQVSAMKLQLNAFRMSVGVDRLKVQIRRGIDPRAVREIREQHRGNWFVHFREGTLYFLPIVAQPGTALGEEVELEAKSHEALSLLSARLNDVASELFPQYAALRLRPFTFEGQRQEMVERAAQVSRCQHPLLSQFTIRPRIAVESRLLEAVQGDLCLMLTFGLDTKWTINAQLHELAQAEIPLEGLYVVRRVQAQGKRRLVGRIARLDSADVIFSEAFDDVPSLSAADVMLEGSRTNFAHCLKRLLGTSYASFDDAREHVTFADRDLHRNSIRAEARLHHLDHAALQLAHREVAGQVEGVGGGVRSGGLGRGARQATEAQPGQRRSGRLGRRQHRLRQRAA